jgi:hydroxymethylpyrimidine/phosphomethylpyrimidine kinase
VHGACAITAITAQNTVGVQAIHTVPAEIVLAQARSVLADIDVGAVKVGMLGTAEVTLTVARVLDELPQGTPVVVDPVMVSESGARLLDTDAQSALVQEIVPRASVLTPNMSEARILAAWTPPIPVARAGVSTDAPRAGSEPIDVERVEVEGLMRAVLALGSGAVVLTGGHRMRAVDLFLDSAREEIVDIPGSRRYRDGAAHGSGCTHSSVLAARLALGDRPLRAAAVARSLAGAAVGRGLREVGAGAGPVDVIGLARMRARAV